MRHMKTVVTVVLLALVLCSSSEAIHLRSRGCSGGCGPSIIGYRWRPAPTTCHARVFASRVSAPIVTTPVVAAPIVSTPVTCPTVISTPVQQTCCCCCCCPTGAMGWVQSSGISDAGSIVDDTPQSFRVEDGEYFGGVVEGGLMDDYEPLPTAAGMEETETGTGVEEPSEIESSDLESPLEEDASSRRFRSGTRLVFTPKSRLKKTAAATLVSMEKKKRRSSPAALRKHLSGRSHTKAAHPILRLEFAPITK